MTARAPFQASRGARSRIGARLDACVAQKAPPHAPSVRSPSTYCRQQAWPAEQLVSGSMRAGSRVARAREAGRARVDRRANGAQHAAPQLQAAPQRRQVAQALDLPAVCAAASCSSSSSCSSCCCCGGGGGRPIESVEASPRRKCYQLECGSKQRQRRLELGRRARLHHRDRCVERCLEHELLAVAGRPRGGQPLRKHAQMWREERGRSREPAEQPAEQLPRQRPSISLTLRHRRSTCAVRRSQAGRGSSLPSPGESARRRADTHTLRERRGPAVGAGGGVGGFEERLNSQGGGEAHASVPIDEQLLQHRIHELHRPRDSVRAGG